MGDYKLYLMPPRKEYWETINKEEDFMKYFSEENKRLMILDIHPNWSGVCELMFPTYKSLGTTIDDFDKRMGFLLMDYDIIKDSTSIKLDKFACTSKPKFLFLMVNLISFFLNILLIHR